MYEVKGKPIIEKRKEVNDFRKEWYLRRNREVTKEEYYELLKQVEEESEMVVQRKFGDKFSYILKLIYNPWLQLSERLIKDYNKAGQIIRGTVVKSDKPIRIENITNRSEGNRWFKLNYNGIEYNIHSQLKVVEILKELLNIPEGWKDEQGSYNSRKA